MFCSGLLPLLALPGAAFVRSSLVHATPAAPLTSPDDTPRSRRSRTLPRRVRGSRCPSMAAVRYGQLARGSMMRTSLLTVVLIWLALLLAACKADKEVMPTVTEPSAVETGMAVETAAPAGRPATDAENLPPELEDVRAVVPWGWSLDDWVISEDTSYVALATTGPFRSPGSNGRTVALYRRAGDSLVEVARFAICCATERFGFREELSVERSTTNLDPDESGMRRLSVAFARHGPGWPEDRSPSFAGVTIGPSGDVTVQTESSENPDETPIAKATVADDPSALVTVTPAHQYPATPGPALTVPAGAIPVGWKVSEALWSPDHQHVAVLSFGGLKQRDVTPVRQLSVYSLGGGRMREIWREVNAWVEINDELAFHDINGDGALEIVYTTGFGNAWTGSPALAMTLTKDGEANDLTYRLPIEASAPSDPVDLNGDGIYEWVAVDASWEAICFCHACSPASIFVLAWDGHEYVDATDRYAEAVDENRLKWSGQLDPGPPSPDASRDAKDKYLSESVGRYLDYWNSGRSTDADRILQALHGYQSFGELSAKRDWIVAALARDPHDPTGSYDLLGECPLPQG